MSVSADVLIIGSGLAALIAAERILAESDLRVLLVSDGAGASPYVHGFCCPVAENDSPELLAEDTLRSGSFTNDPALVRAMTNEAAGMTEYLTHLGLKLDEKDGKPLLIQSLGSAVPRIAMVGNDTGMSVIRAIRERIADDERFQEKRGTRLLHFIKREGRVVGTWFLGPEGTVFPAYARVTILAAGGYSALFPFTTNSPDMGGDALIAAIRAGAETTALADVQFEPCVSVWPEKTRGKGMITTIFYEGAALRNALGERFMVSAGTARECVDKDVLARAIFRELKAGRGTAHGGVWFDATKVDSALFEGVYKPYLKRYLDAGIDLRKEPVEVAPGAHTSLGGIRIAPDTHTTVGGLLAAGECAGGIHGKNRLGGNGGLAAMAFGRIAGKTAIEEALAKPLPEATEAEERAAFTELECVFAPVFGRKFAEEKAIEFAEKRRIAFGRGAFPEATAEDRRLALEELKELQKEFEMVAPVKPALTLDKPAVRAYQDLAASMRIIESSEERRRP